MGIAPNTAMTVIRAPADLCHLVGKQVVVWPNRTRNLPTDVVTVVADDEMGNRRLYKMHAADLAPIRSNVACPLRIVP